MILDEPCRFKITIHDKKAGKYIADVCCDTCVIKYTERVMDDHGK